MAAPVETPLSGEDAVAIDWGVKYCGMMSTDKEHALASPPATQAMYTSIKGRNGPKGSRLEGLVKWEGASAASGDSRQAVSTATRPEGKGRRH